MNVSAVRLSDDELVEKLRQELNFGTRPTVAGLKPGDCLTDEDVRTAKSKELASIISHGVFEVVDIPKGVVPTETRWVLREKAGLCKARLVVKDFARTQST